MDIHEHTADIDRLHERKLQAERQLAAAVARSHGLTPGGDCRDYGDEVVALQQAEADYNAALAAL